MIFFKRIIFSYPLELFFYMWYNNVNSIYLRWNQMNIGEKIKTLRTSKLMTQSELAGNEITRNMLSRIENGAAQPSLDTLKYLAKRLNVSTGFLLADSTDEQMYIKHKEIYSIKSAYLSGDYRICRDICLKSSTSSDDEIQMILAECTLEIAIEEFSLGNLHEACRYFDLAIQACAQTVYNTEHILAVSAMYFKYMRNISAMLSSDYIDENEAPLYSSYTDHFCLYMGAFLSLKCNDEQTKGLENIITGEGIYALHIKAIKHMSNSEYDAAIECLNRILFGDISIPKPMIYYLFCDLEICSKEIEDFKGAYEYSIDKIEIIQKLLS